eukprot:gene10546-10706_t
MQVQNLLQKVRPEWTDNSFQTLELTTHGDKEKELHMRALGQGAFTEVIDQAVAEGVVDIGVHSLKDSPVVLPQGVQLAACLARDDPRDAMISLKAHTLADLPRGARVGTSSLRRKAQILHTHPHLNVVPVRGNIDRRLEALHKGELDAIVLAAAGLSRLGQQHIITRVLDLQEMLPAACQGAIGVTCSSKDAFLRWELGLICHEPTRLEVAAERAMLGELLKPKPGSAEESQDQAAGQDSTAGSHDPVNTTLRSGRFQSPAGSALKTAKGISSITGLPLLPSFAIACHAAFDPHDGVLRVDGLVASEDGRVMHRLQESGGAGNPGEAEAIGGAVGQHLREFALQHGWFDEE